MNTTLATERLQELEAEAPDALRLARLVSLSVRIERHLLRRLRLDLLPAADVGCEADLWFSPIVESWGSSSFVIDSTVALLLRRDLARESETFERAARITELEHQHMPASIQLEEKLHVIAARGGDDVLARIDEAMAPALRALREGERAKEVARWAMRALPRFDPVVRKSGAALALLLRASGLLGGRRIVRERTSSRAALNQFAWAIPAAAFSERARIAVEVTDTAIRFVEDPDPGDAPVLELPHTTPLLVEVSWLLGDARVVNLVEVEIGNAFQVDTGVNALTFRALDGSEYLLQKQPAEQLRMGHGSELSMMDTRALLEASIGSDAYLAAEAAIEIEKRGADETKRIFDADWQKAPERATTENFLRDVFHAFGENFAYHLVDVLEEGARSAVDVAIYAFPRAKDPEGRLYSWADRQVNRRLADFGTMVLPMIAIGSAGLVAYARDVIKRADDKRNSIVGETLVRLFVQADSRHDADRVLEVMCKFIQDAHDQRWPNPGLLLTGLPTWPLTSAAVDSLVESGLAANQLPEIRSFASDAIICAGTRRVVSQLIQQIQRNQINRADAIRLIAIIGGPEAAQFVIAAPGTARDQALVLPWLAPTLDAAAVDAFLRDDENRFLVSRALGLAKTKADWIEGVLESASSLNRGYAGLAYARGSEAKRALVDALDAVHGEGSEAVQERILLNAALVVAGAHEHAQEILRLLPAHPLLREDLAKQDVLAALSIALGQDHLAVRAWRRVGCAPATLDPKLG